MTHNLQAVVDREVERAIKRAMWACDTDTLNRLAGCICCCADHTFGSNCPAHRWGGCRGGSGFMCLGMSMDDVRGWAKHYGMTVEKFCRPFDVDLPTAG